MQNVLRAVLFWALILSGCTPSLPSTAPVSASTSEVPATVPTITIPPDAQNCGGYQWAYQDLPELSSSFQASIQALQPEAQASAFAFGEDCFLPDGSFARFLPMETDFNITLQVDDVKNESNLGEWIVKVMQVVENIPTEQVVGPRPGRVNLVFQSDTAQTAIHFYIDQYQALPAGLSNTEIYQELETPQ